MRRLSLGLAVAATIVFTAAGDVFACACCSNKGQRNVNVDALDQSKRALLEELRFADRAELFLGEADPDSVEGIANPSSSYVLEAVWEGNRIVFTLNDEKGGTGTLALPLPGKISLFEVDPRDGPDAGTGPSLYKEWKVSAKPIATGAFAPAAASGHTLTLIVQGSGNSCPSASDFGYWTLVMQGPKANYSLFGDLARAP
jgi:hypothetical protein